MLTPAQRAALARIDDALTDADEDLREAVRVLGDEPEPYIGVTVSVTASELDGAPIVQIDTDESLEGPADDGEPQIRVYVNDWCAFEGKPYDPADDDA